MTWSVCVAASVEGRQCVREMGGKSYVSSLNLQPQLEAAVAALSHHSGGDGGGGAEFMVCVSVATPV